VPARRVLRRIRRVAQRVALIFAGVVLLAVVTALIVVHTDWGRNKIRVAILDAMADSFRCGVEIRALEGSVVGDAVLRGVVIKSCDGQPAITAERVAVNVDLGELISGTIALEYAEASGVAVDVHKPPGGELNFATLYTSSPEPFGWNIALGNIRLRDASVRFDIDGRIAHLVDVSANAALDVKVDGSIAGRLGTLDGMWVEQGAPIHLDGDVAVNGDAITVGALHAKVTGIVAVEATGVRYAGPAKAQGTVTIDVVAGSLQRFLTEQPKNPPAHIVLTLTPGVNEPNVQLLVNATAGDENEAAVAGTLYITPDGPTRIGGVLSVTGANAEWFARDAVKTQISATAVVALELDGDRLGKGLPVSGTIALDGSGTIGDLAIDHIGGHVFVHDHSIYAIATALAPGEASATVIGTLTVEDEGAIKIEHARIKAHVEDIGTLVPAAGIGGAADADLTITGTLSDKPPVLTVDGKVNGRRLRMDDLRVARADVVLHDARIDLANPDHPRGGATAVLSGVRKGTAALPTVSIRANSRAAGGYQVRVASSGEHLIAGGARWSVDADAVVHPRDRFRAAKIVLGSYTLRTDGVPWAGRGGTIDVTRHAIDIRKVAGQVDGGSFAVDGKINPGTLGIDGTVRITHVELSQIDRALGLTGRGIGPLRGRADLTAEIHRHGSRLTGSIAGTINTFAMREDADPIDITIDAKIDPKRIAGTVSAKGAAIGSAELAIDVIPPRDPTDLGAWSRLERSAIRSVIAKAVNVDIVALTSSFGIAPPIDATVSADLQLTATSSVGEIHARDLVVSGAPGMIDLDATLDLARPGEVVAHATATVREIGTATIEATVRVPSRPFDVKGWRALDIRAIKGATVTVDEITVDDKIAKRFGLGGLRGRIGGSIDVTEALREIHARAVGRGITGGPLARPVDLVVDAKLDADGAEVTVNGALDGVAVLTATASAPVDPGQLVGDARKALSSVPITGSASIAKTEIASVLRTFGEERRLNGTISGEGTFAGTLGDPTATLAVVVEDLGGKRQRVKKLTIDGTYAGGVLTAELEANQVGNGRLHATARYEVAKPEATEVRFAAVRFQVAPLFRLVPDAVGIRGILDANLTVTGADPYKMAITGTVKVKEAQVPIIDMIGAITNGSAELTFTAGHVKIKARGDIESGDAELTADADLGGLLPTRGTLDVTVRDIALITTMQPRFASKLHAEVKQTDHHWHVVARVEDTEVVIPEEEGKPLHQATPPNDMVFIENGRIKRPARAVLAALVGRRPSDPFLTVDLTIRPVEIVSKELRGVVEGHLDIEVGDDGIWITDEISARRGEVMVFDRRYLLNRASLRFDGGIDPMLDIEMQHDFTQLAMTVDIHGRLSDPELELTSQPGNYTEGQLLGFLLGGTPGSGGQDSRDALTGAASTVASQTVGGFVTRRLPVKIDVLRFEPATSSSSAAFAVGKWINQKFLVLVRSRIEPREDENRGETEIEYWLGRRLLLDAVGGDKGVLGLDLLWTKRW
jgi:hypothetical protein